MSKYPLIKQKREKLIRDRIPALMKRDKEDREIRVCKDDDELLGFVQAKVIEEAREVAEATTRDEIIEELGDLSEICAKLMNMNDITWEDVRKVRDSKALRAGEFNRRFILTLIY